MASTAKTFLVRPLAFFAVIVSALATAGCGINNIPTYEQSAKAAWSEVLNQYKRRTDLIPNLVESVKGFAAQEKSVLTEVTKAREQVTNIQLPPDILTNPDAMKKFQDAQATLSGARAPVTDLAIVSGTRPGVSRRPMIGRITRKNRK